MNERGIEDLINTLFEVIQEARNVPLSSEKCIIEREKVLDMLDEILNQLPGELKQAKTIVESRTEVINNSKREAENILKNANAQAKEMISESEIMKQAQAEAAALMQQAREESEELLRRAQEESDATVRRAEDRIRELKRVTTEFVDQSLKTTEESITDALSEIRDTRRKFNVVVGAQKKPENPAIIEDID